MTASMSHAQEVLAELVELARTHSCDEIDALVMAGQFAAAFPAIEEIPDVGALRRWDDRPAAVPGDVGNELLAQGKGRSRRARG